MKIIICILVVIISPSNIAQESEGPPCPVECSCYHSTFTEGLTVDCDKKFLQMTELAIPQFTSELLLCKTGILDIKKIHPLTSVERLELCDNGLTQFQLEQDSMPSLLILDLSGNLLSRIPENLPSKLKVLMLSYNKITQVDSAAVNHLKELEELYLDGNNLEILAANCFIGEPLDDIENGFPYIQKLALNQNKIKIIQDGAFQGLGVLNAMTLSNNRLDNLSRYVFRGLDDLEFLDLRKNRIETVNNNTFLRLTKMKHMYLSWNFLQEVPHGLPILEWLDLSHNEIRRIHVSRKSDLFPIEILNLAHNPLHCDCNMLWLKELYDRREYILKNSDIPPAEFVPTCLTPPSLSGESWTFLGDDVFSCDDEDEDYRAKYEVQTNKADMKINDVDTLDSVTESKYHEKSIKYKTGEESNKKSPSVEVFIQHISPETCTIKWTVIGTKDSSSVKWIFVKYYVFGQRDTTTMYAQVSSDRSQYTLVHLQPQTNYVVCVTMEKTESIDISQCVEIQTNADMWQRSVLNTFLEVFSLGNWKVLVGSFFLSLVFVGVGLFFFETLNYIFSRLRTSSEKKDS